MDALKGIRVAGIPEQTSVLHLQKYFSSNDLSGGGATSEIIFPLLGNEAIVFFRTQKDATSVMTRDHEKFLVRPLPHQVFASVEAVLDPGMAALVISSTEHIRYLREGGLKLCERGEDLLMQGDAYHLEYAWAYLHAVMDKQFHIQDHLLGGITSTAVDVGQNQSSSTSSSPGSTPRRSRPPSGRRKDDSLRTGASGLVNGHEENGQQSPRTTSASKTTRKTSNTGSKAASSGSVSAAVEAPRLSSQHPQPAARDAQQLDTALSLSPETIPKSLELDFMSSPASHTPTDSPRPQPAPRSSVAERISSSSHVRGYAEFGETDLLSLVSDEGSPARRYDADRTFDQFLSLPSTHGRDAASRADRTAEFTRDSALQGRSLGSSGERQSSFSSLTTTQALGGAEAGEHLSKVSQSAFPDSTKTFSFDLGNGVTVKIYLGDITRVHTEGVVNAANSELQNWSGVAGALLKAAGPKLRRECDDFIARHGRLDMTDVTHTGAGNMTNVVYVIHTVGPFYLEGEDQKCRALLQRTFYNCLHYSNGKRLRSISFPFISTGVFSVPLDVCVEAFLDAVLLFVFDQKDTVFKLKQIDLVHNDPEVVCTAIVMLRQLLQEDRDTLVARALSRSSSQDCVSPADYLTSGVAAAAANENEFGSRSSLNRKRSSSFSHTSKKKASNDLDFKSLAVGSSAARGGSHSSDRDEPTPTPSPRIRSSSVDRRTRPSSESGARPKTSTSSSKSSTSTTSSTRPSSAMPLGQSSKYLGSTDLHTRGTGLGKKTSSGGSPSSRGQPMKAFASDHEGAGSRTLSTTSYLDKYDPRVAHSPRHNEDFMMHSLPADLNKGKRSLFDQCPICLEDMVLSSKLKCGHEFCKKCIDRAFSTRPVCPTCGKVYGPLVGDQPRGGRMIDTIERSTILPGYENANGAIVIQYSIPSGTQERHHPNPGRHYSGIERTAYLPNNTEGREVLRLLKKAFDAGLTFTISDSRTTGAEGVITWAEIHHKTRTFGGSTNFGYPDSTYLKRVKEELALKGITP